MQQRLGFILLVLVLSSTPTHGSPGGVVVERITPGYAGERAGIMPGDRLSSWAPVGEEGTAVQKRPIRDPFDLEFISLEHGLRGPTEVSIFRDGEPVSAVIEAVDWGIDSRPVLQGENSSALERGMELLAAGQTQRGTAALRELASTLAENDDEIGAAWCFVRMAEVFSAHDQWREADSAFSEALVRARGVTRADVEAIIHTRWARRLKRQSKLAEAADEYRRAVEAARYPQSTGLAAAGFLVRLASVEQQQGRLKAAGAALAEAQVICDRVVPGSFAAAKVLIGLATLSFRRDRDFEQVHDYCRRALGIVERTAPESMEHAEVLHTMASVSLRSGDRLVPVIDTLRRSLQIKQSIDPEAFECVVTLVNLSVEIQERHESATLLHQALAIAERHQPGGLQTALILSNLALSLVDSGDLSAAENLLRRALAIRKRLAPENPVTAKTLTNLGVLLRMRGDLVAAEEVAREAYNHYQRSAPDSIGSARLLHTLAVLVQEKGDLEAADAYFRQCVDILEGIESDHPFLIDTLHRLFALAMERGDIDAAEEALTKAADLLPHASAMDEREMAHSLCQGDLAAAKGDIQAALTHYERTMEVFRANGNSPEVAYGNQLQALNLLIENNQIGRAESVAKQTHRFSDVMFRGTLTEVPLLHAEAKIARRQGRPEEAERSLRMAVDILEHSRTMLSGQAESSLGFTGRYDGVYRDLVAVLIELQRADEAFDVLECAKTGSLVDMIATRDLMLDIDVPREHELAWREADREFIRAQEELNDLGMDADPKIVSEKIAELRARRDRRSAVVARIRRQSPKLASLRFPTALSLAETRRTLESGTVLLSYSISESSCFLFLLSTVAGEKTPFAALDLAVEEGTLDNEIAVFRDYLLSGSPRFIESFRVHGRRLYDWLVAPAERWLTGAKRVVICPDAALGTLPFAALVRASPAGEQYLIEWKPLHCMTSATFYDQLKRRDASQTRSPSIVVIGDPVYRDGCLSKGGPELASLPGSRQEVEGIAAVWGDAATVFAGDEATEEQAKALTKTVAIVHFACHGALDRRLPLNSALVLSVPPGDQSPAGENGLLQAWEIFEQVRLEADLVILSACDTGIGGQGLLGLTHAFHYAGARSVVASLWKVPDASTAILMSRFHAALKNGESPDRALQRAQIELLSGGVTPQGQALDITHPRSWAGFTLFGYARTTPTSTPP